MLEYIIPAAASLLGGVLSSDSNRDSNAANLANQNAINAQNVALQKEFAQNGIRWKVEDAKAAGLHPLAALGAQTSSFAPISVGAQNIPDNSIGGSVSAAGQDIGRAIHATSTAEERAADAASAAALAAQQTARQETLDRINLEKHVADLDHMWMQNQLLASQIKRLEAQTNPPMPRSAGSRKGIGVENGPPTRFGVEKYKPAEITSANPFNQSRTAGPPGPGVTRYRFGGPRTGFTVDLPAGSSVSEGLESMGSLYSLFTMGRHHVSQYWDDFTSPDSPRSQYMRELQSLGR